MCTNIVSLRTMEVPFPHDGLTTDLTGSLMGFIVVDKILTNSFFCETIVITKFGSLRRA